jgi:hypothetical protein
LKDRPKASSLLLGKRIAVLTGSNSGDPTRGSVFQTFVML